MMMERTTDEQEPSYADCPEDCPRCNRCPPTVRRRRIIQALINETELDKEQSEASVGLQSLLPPIDWHKLVQEALSK